MLPFWFSPFLPDDFRVLQVLRILRFFKIARYSPAIRSLLDVLYRERRALFGCTIITLGTIGYGDVVPVTALGKLVATATIFLGLVMIALPVGIIATAFAEQIHRAISSSPAA